MILNQSLPTGISHVQSPAGFHGQQPFNRRTGGSEGVAPAGVHGQGTKPVTLRTNRALASEDAQTDGSQGNLGESSSLVRDNAPDAHFQGQQSKPDSVNADNSRGKLTAFSVRRDNTADAQSQQEAWPPSPTGEMMQFDSARVNEGSNPSLAVHGQAEMLGTHFIDLDPEKFDDYLSEKGDGVWISAITSKQKGKGHFSQLVRELQTKYKWIKIPTPSNQMIAVAEHLGFIMRTEWFGEPFNESGTVMFWERGA